MAAIFRTLGFGARGETRDGASLARPKHQVLCPKTYAQAAVLLSEQACRQSTFGVGGVLLENKTGKVLHSMHHGVFQDNATRDPSAHGERQMIAWYLLHRFSKRLPPPSEVTIVTTMDPCAMCTGALLASGINVATMCYDDGAGINWTRRRDFRGLPSNLRYTANQQFSYFAIPGMPWMGPQSSVFYEESVSDELNGRAAKAFLNSLPAAHAIFAREDPAPQNIAELPATSLQRELLAKIWPFSVDTTIDLDESFDRTKLKAVLYVVGAGADNAAALIDPFGNLLLVMRSGPSVIDTALTNLVRAYAECRWQVKDLQGNRASDGHLPHIKRCKVVLFNGPGRGPRDVLDLGLYGSALQSKAQGEKGGLYYFNPSQTPKELKSMIQDLPPLYSNELGISATQLELSTSHHD